MRPPPTCSSLVVRPDTATDEWSRVCDASSDLPDATYQDAWTKRELRLDRLVADRANTSGNYLSMPMRATKEYCCTALFIAATLNYPVTTDDRIYTDQDGSIVDQWERPGDNRIETYAADNRTLVAVNAGAALLSGPDLSQTLGAGQAVHLVGTNPPAAFSVALPPPMTSICEADNATIT